MPTTTKIFKCSMSICSNTSITETHIRGPYPDAPTPSCVCGPMLLRAVERKPMPCGLCEANQECCEERVDGECCGRPNTKFSCLFLCESVMDQGKKDAIESHEGSQTLAYRGLQCVQYFHTIKPVNTDEIVLELLKAIHHFCIVEGINFREEYKAAVAYYEDQTLP